MITRTDTQINNCINTALQLKNIMIDATSILGDEDAEKIILATRAKPLADREIPHVCGIPIAVAYKKISLLERIGVLKCVFVGSDKRGRKVKFYRSNIENAYVYLDRGRTKIRLAVALDISNSARNKWNSFNSRIIKLR